MFVSVILRWGILNLKEETSQLLIFLEDFKFIRHYFGLLMLKTQGNYFGITSLRPHGLNQCLTCDIKGTNIWQFPSC